VLDGETALTILSEADKVAGASRALGSRGQRLLPAWESNLMNRWAAFFLAGTNFKAQRSYKEFAYRVVSRYTLAKVANDTIARIPQLVRHVANPVTAVNIIHMNASAIIPAAIAPAPGLPIPPPPLPQWGEAQFWDANMQQALLDGRAQFIDVEGFSVEEISQIIGCLAPSTYDNVPHLRLPIPHPEAGDFLPTSVRHTFPNATTHIIVHHGNNPLPTAVQQNWIADHAFDFPVQMHLEHIQRTFSARHGLEDVFLQAYDSILYRSVGYTFDSALGTAAAKRDATIADASGHYNLFLPRNVTGIAYFDVFFLPVPITSDLNNFMRLPTTQLVNSISLASHARATSTAWAAKAGAVLGDVWDGAGAIGNEFLRNHRALFVRLYYNEINIWSTLHANAQAFQYGFAPTVLTRRTEQAHLVNWWRGYTVPTFTNHYLELWMMQLIPTFQVLPYYSGTAATSHVEWAKGTPDQVASLQAFGQDKRILLAREFSALPGHAWCGDGGAEYNFQFYAAQGNNGLFAYEGGAHKSAPSYWNGLYARSVPMAPQPGTLLTMTNGALNQPFADFLLPGSLSSYHIQSDRIRNWTVGEAPGSQLTPLEQRRWWLASKGQAHTSLMVNYRSPISEHYELDTLADYTVTIWESAGKFAALTFSDITFQLAKDNFDTINHIEEQKPFSLNFDSAPQQFEQHHPARVSKRENRGPLAEAINNRIAGLNDYQDAKITYESKYPTFESELPDFGKQVIDVDFDGLRARDWSPSTGLTAKKRLQQLQEVQDKVDRDWEATLAELQRAETLARVSSSTTDLAKPSSYITTVPRRKQRKLDATALNVHFDTSVPSPDVAHPRANSVVVQTTRPLNTPKPVVPNDSPAPAAQRRASAFLEELTAVQGRRTAEIRAGQRYKSPRRNIAEKDFTTDFARAVANHPSASANRGRFPVKTQPPVKLSPANTTGAPAIPTQNREQPPTMSGANYPPLPPQPKSILKTPKPDYPPPPTVEDVPESETEPHDGEDDTMTYNEFLSGQNDGEPDRVAYADVPGVVDFSNLPDGSSAQVQAEIYSRMAAAAKHVADYTATTPKN
jgi:uncharacterized protein YozE (UPF0346 family)